jgi:hypothetical protein
MFEATSCDRYFSVYTSAIPDVWKITISIPDVWKITISMLNNFFTIGFRAKNSIARV